MKKILFVLFAILSTIVIKAQLVPGKVVEGPITLFDDYKINKGDTLYFGQGIGAMTNFIYIRSGDNLAGPGLAGTKLVIKALKLDVSKLGKKYYAVVNPGSIFNYSVELENAIRFGEVIGVNSIKFNQKKQSQTPEIQTKSSVADEIKKLKELLDGGVISKSEFEAQKKKILE